MLTLTNSTVSGNSAGSGGGIYNSSAGYATITNSTVSENDAYYDGAAYYGGIGGSISNRGDLSLTNSTVSGNTADDLGGGITNIGNVYLDNAIVAANSAPLGANCSNGLNSLGNNLTDDTSCGLTEPTDLVVADAMLGPLQDNGGPTETHDLLPGSPAIDAGSVDCPPPATDQRGVSRPQGTDCDIGAVEYVPEPAGWLMLAAGTAFLGLLYRRRALGLRLS